jgi:hypothetical protein
MSSSEKAPREATNCIILSVWLQDEFPTQNSLLYESILLYKREKEEKKGGRDRKRESKRRNGGRMRRKEGKREGRKEGGGERRKEGSEGGSTD